jgi:hypothetical protein
MVAPLKWYDATRSSRDVVVVGLGHARIVMGADVNDKTALRFAKELAYSHQTVRRSRAAFAIKRTRLTQEITPYQWVHPERIGKRRLVNGLRQCGDVVATAQRILTWD